MLSASAAPNRPPSERADTHLSSEAVLSYRVHADMSDVLVELIGAGREEVSSTAAACMADAVEGSTDCVGSSQSATAAGADAWQRSLAEEVTHFSSHGFTVISTERFTFGWGTTGRDCHGPLRAQAAGSAGP